MVRDLGKWMPYFAKALIHFATNLFALAKQNRLATSECIIAFKHLKHHKQSPNFGNCSNVSNADDIKPLFAHENIGKKLCDNKKVG